MVEEYRCENLVICPFYPGGDCEVCEYNEEV